MNRKDFNFDCLPAEWKPSEKRLNDFFKYCLKDIDPNNGKATGCVFWSVADPFEGLIRLNPTDETKDIYVPEYSKQERIQRIKKKSKESKKRKKRFSINNRSYYVNKIVYAWAYGEIVTDTTIISNCDNKNCIYFGHLQKRKKSSLTQKKNKIKDSQVKCLFEIKETNDKIS